MTVEIRIKNKIVTINLLNKDAILDSVTITEEHRLSEELLSIVERLLKRNGLETENVDKMTLVSDMGENFTTHRIAKAVVEAFNWAKKM